MSTIAQPRSRTVMLTSFAATAAAVALVIWIKLRVVSTIPKQAYADPGASVADAQPAFATPPTGAR